MYADQVIEANKTIGLLVVFLYWNRLLAEMQ